MSSTPTEMVFAIDPGTERSAWVLLDGTSIEFGMNTNDYVLSQCYAVQIGSHRTWLIPAIEKVASYGMAVGEEVFQTVFWSGRFAEALSTTLSPIERPTRKQVVTHLCGSAKAKDANVRQALIDRFGGPDAIRKGGFLYKVSKDVWAALAVAVWVLDNKTEVKA